MNRFDWTVIGAGPAGIAAVGKLLDYGQKNILWIDPEFQVGDFGTKWHNVPSNTKVNLFLKFFNACRSFHYDKSPNFAIHQLNPDGTCELSMAAIPLQWITEQLQKHVFSLRAHAKKLIRRENQWEIHVDNQIIRSTQVILAIGAEPKTLPVPSQKIIPLDIALNKDKLRAVCKPTDTIAVFGSSHSAILIIRDLLESCNIHKVINFYRTPLCYAVYVENKILFDDAGLKGEAAAWARKNIDGQLPEKLTRIKLNENIDPLKVEYTKAICAVGFRPRTIAVEGMGELTYNGYGMIAPGLFGIGIAFPEITINHIGQMSARVGLWKFMEYIDRLFHLLLVKNYHNQV